MHYQKIYVDLLKPSSQAFHIMNFIPYITLLIFVSTRITNKTSLVNSPFNSHQQKPAVRPDSSVKELMGAWVLTDNEKHANPLPVKKIILTATEISVYTNDKLHYKTKYIATADTLLKKTTGILNLRINLPDIYEQWHCQVLLPKNSVSKSHTEASSLLIMPEPDCRCSCPYEIYIRKEK